jgi:hypothetical protein
MKPPPQARQISMRAPEVRAEPQCVVMLLLAPSVAQHGAGACFGPPRSPLRAGFADPSPLERDAPRGGSGHRL